mgnify:FL=1
MTCFTVAEATRGNLRDICEYLCLATRQGPPSVFSRPLAASCRLLTQSWEWGYLQQFGRRSHDQGALHEPTATCEDSLDTDRLCDVMKIADILEIESLVELACACLASSLQGCASDADVGMLFARQLPTEAEIAAVVAQLPFLAH